MIQYHFKLIETPAYINTLQVKYANSSIAVECTSQIFPIFKRGQGRRKAGLAQVVDAEDKKWHEQDPKAGDVGDNLPLPSAAFASVRAVTDDR
jgi:hypothetical protein